MASPEALHPVKRLYRLLKAERSDILYIYFYAIVTGLISLSLPLGIQAIINYVQTAQVSTSWVVLVLLVTVGIAVQGFLQIMQLSISETIQQRIFVNSAFEFAYRIPRLDLDHLHKHYAPELVNRFFDTLTLQKGMSKIVLDLSASSLQILFGLILLSLYHPFFIIFGIFLLAVLTLVVRFTSPSGLKTSMAESKYKFAVAHWLEEIARSVELFKVAGNPELPLQRTDSLIQNYLVARKKHFRILASKYTFLIGFKVLIIGALLVLGSLLVINGQMNIGQFVAVEIVIILLMGSVEKLILSIETVYDVLTALDKIGFVTDMPLERDGGDEILATSKLHLKVRNLRFTYPDTSRPAVQALDFTAAPGEKICITGGDEIGKTAFLRLMAGFYAQYEGNIAYDDIPLRNISLCSLRRQIGGFVDVRDVFDGSIRDNIALGDSSISVERIVEIAKLVGLMSFVESHPEGLNYRITPEPEKIPEIILRKVVLARALVLPARVLLLEDPLQGFTLKERERILAYLLYQLEGVTVVLAADTLDGTGRFDKTYNMEEGVLSAIA
jgi:ABC-type bacteriocin/lantibiotic exporter with double-glycine peptidase domain